MLMGQVDYGSFAMIKRIRALVSGKTVFPAATRTGFRKISRFQERLNAIRDALRTHNVYSEINRLAAVRTFMEIHVFAVWDFMSLLKALQRRLCCVDSPWLPPADPQSCRFVNEIVLAEEADHDGRGGFASHFELYHRAMTQCGADTTAIDGFVADLRRGVSLRAALASPTVPEVARRFVEQTFEIIESGNIYGIASAFTYGREDLLPDVFQRIVDKMNAEVGGQLDDFRHYLLRHIGLDGDEHGPMAARLVQSLCGSSGGAWERAEQAAVDCLNARKEMWDGIGDAIRRRSITGARSNCE